MPVPSTPAGRWSPGWWNIVEASGGWENIVVVNTRNPKNARFEGKSVAQIAEEWGKDPWDAAWDLVLEGDGRVMAIYHMMSERDIRTALQYTWTTRRTKKPSPSSFVSGFIILKLNASLLYQAGKRPLKIRRQ